MIPTKNMQFYDKKSASVRQTLNTSKSRKNDLGLKKTDYNYAEQTTINSVLTYFTREQSSPSSVIWQTFARQATSPTKQFKLSYS